MKNPSKDEEAIANEPIVVVHKFRSILFYVPNTGAAIFKKITWRAYVFAGNWEASTTNPFPFFGNHDKLTSEQNLFFMQNWHYSYISFFCKAT